MSDLTTFKAELRKTALSARRAIPDKTRKSELIAERVFCDPDYIAARTVAVYKSLSSEVGTDLIIAHALHSGKRVVLPKVFGDTMDFFEIREGEKLQKSSFGVLEPAGEESRRVSPEEFDLVLVPGLCFDRGGNRLGFGRGYYDRFLPLTRGKAVGLCFDEQLCTAEVIPTDEYDVKMHKIITEKESI